MPVEHKDYVFDTTLDQMLAEQGKQIDLLEARLNELEAVGDQYHEVKRYLCNVTSTECDISRYIKSEVQRCQREPTIERRKSIKK